MFGKQHNVDWNEIDDAVPDSKNTFVKMKQNWTLQAFSNTMTSPDYLMAWILQCFLTFSYLNYNCMSYKPNKLVLQRLVASCFASLISNQKYSKVLLDHQQTS